MLKLKLSPILLLFVLNNSFAQQKFELSNEGYNQPVAEFSISQDSIFKLAENWVKRTFVDSEEVIQSTVENEMIRFQTHIPKGYRLSIVTYNLKIRFRIDVKDGKYRLTIEELQDQPTDEISWRTMDLPAYFNKNDELRKMYTKMFDQINEHLNRINQSLFEAVSGKKKAVADDW